MKTLFFLALLICSFLAISCEQDNELIATGSDDLTEVTGLSDSLPATRSTTPRYREFYLNIQGEGGPHSVGIINRLKDPEETIIVTSLMSPFYYKVLLPEDNNFRDDAIEILSTDASMRFIQGFSDDYGSYKHSLTYHYAALWNDSKYITAIFDPTDPRPDPLPKGVPWGSAAPSPTDVLILMERGTGVYTIMATYKDESGNIVTTGVDAYTRFLANTSQPLQLLVLNSSMYTGILNFDTGKEKKEVKIPPGSFNLSYSLKDLNGLFKLRIY